MRGEKRHLINWRQSFIRDEFDTGGNAVEAYSAGSKPSDIINLSPDEYRVVRNNIRAHLRDMLMNLGLPV